MDAGQSSATRAMEVDIAAASSDDPGHDWDALEKVFSELALADMASKAQLLQSLSSFLSCVATTMSFSAEFQTLSASVGASTVFLSHKEVAQLHDLVIRELKEQTCFLSELSGANKKIDEGADGNFTRVLNLELVSQTLRCCIRILPLVDCFDKSGSLASTKLLDGILRQLSHPTKLFHLLGLKTSVDEHSRRGCQIAQGDEDGSRHQAKEPPEACTTNRLDLDSQHRMELVFAILEVYVDELLLRPELTARLLMSRESMCRSLAEEQVTCYVKHTEASLEAAFVHVLSSLHSEASLRSRKGFLVCNLSLPAGLLLLEKFSEEEVPPFFTAHVVRLLGRMLNDATALGFGQVEDLRARPNVLESFSAGGVDWSYCSEELMRNCDFEDKYFFTKLSQSETTLNFASSILEHAILQYRKISIASDACSDGTGPFRFQTFKCLLVFYLSKYSSLCSVFGESSKLNTIDAPSGSGDIGAGHLKFYRDYFQCSFSGVLNAESKVPLEYGSGASGFAGFFMRQGVAAGYYSRHSVVIGNADAKDTAGSVIALLQLMSSALKCIVREVSMSTWLSDSIGNQFPNDISAMPLSESNAADFDKILQCVGLHLSLCLPSTTGLFSVYHEQQCGRAGEGEGKGAQGTLNKLVGQAIVFFTNVLCEEVRRTVPDEVLEEYFHLVECLVALLTGLHVRNDRRKSAAECALIGNGLFDDICRTSLEISAHREWENYSPSDQQLPKSDNVSSYLNEMVLSLQGMLRDLSEQERSLPEFLLSFVLKQLSKRDALSLVAQAFNSCLHSHLDDFPTVTRGMRVFQSDGLVAEVLHLALSEPTRPLSLYKFIVYMVDILQDNLPITTALSLSDITELISWFQTIAYSLTLASQVVVRDPRMFVRNGKDRFTSLISKMSEGIDRILSEGIATAHWLAHLSKAMSEEAWHKLTESWDPMGITGKASREEAWNPTGSLEKCNIFLGQVEMLRKAVQELARSVDSSLDGELAPLLEKGRIFFTALSNILTGTKLVGSQWSSYLSRQNQQHSNSSQLGGHLQAISTDPVLGYDHVYAQLTDFCSVSSQLEPADAVVEAVQECEKTPARDVIPIGDQIVLIGKVSSREELRCPTENHLGAGEEVGRMESDDGPLFPSAETIVSTTVDTDEKGLTTSMTSLTAPKLNTQADVLGSEKPLSTPHELKRNSSTTSAIMKRLLQSRSQPSRIKSTNGYQTRRKKKLEQKWGSCEFADDVLTDEDIPASAGTNVYVDSLNKQDPSTDNFDDLKDFIVPRKGRNYSVWLKRRQKVRRRLHSKNFFRRLREKKELLCLLDI